MRGLNVKRGGILGYPGDAAIDGEEGAFERTLRGIQRDIYSGVLTPGHRLVEPELMRRFGVGRNTLREVFNRLSSAGVIELVRHRGAMVLVLSRADILELLDVVATLFSLGARLAARRVRNGIGGAASLQLTAHTLQHAEIYRDFSEFASLREAFYDGVFDLAGNREARRTFPFSRVHMMRVQLRPYSHAADAVQLKDYLALAIAVADGDEARAAKRAEAHVRRTIDLVKKVPDEAFAPSAWQARRRPKAKQQPLSATS
jgi:DNA-binding GntR family transcriptional regulator